MQKLKSVSVQIYSQYDWNLMTWPNTQMILGSMTYLILLPLNSSYNDYLTPTHPITHSKVDIWSPKYVSYSFSTFRISGKIFEFSETCINNYLTMYVECLNLLTPNKGLFIPCGAHNHSIYYKWVHPYKMWETVYKNAKCYNVYIHRLLPIIF